MSIQGTVKTSNSQLELKKNFCDALIDNTSLQHDWLLSGASHAALHIAAYTNNTYSIQILLDDGAKIEIRDGLMQTPLCMAASRCNLDATKLLLQRGANINARKMDSSTAAMLAAGNGFITTLQYLIKSGANLDITTNKGQTILHLGGYGTAQFFSYLLGLGCDPYVLDNTKESPIEIAMKYSRNQSSLFSLLLN